MKRQNQEFENIKYDTIYIGGGTPTALDEEALEFMVEMFADQLKPTTEFTVETNPENITVEKVNIMKKHGVNRISMGVQSFNDKIVAMLGRQHDEGTVERALKIIEDAGIDNVTIDLIYNLPGQRREDIAYDLKRVKELGVPHVSIYALELKEGSRLTTSGYVKDDKVEEEYMDIVENNINLNRYEVSNYSLPGYESKHNMAYWHSKEWDAIGFGAEGFKDGRLVHNRGTISEWSVTSTPQTQKEIDFQILMMGLRLVEGLPYKGRYKDALEVHWDKLKDHIIIENDKFRVKNLDMLNSVLVEIV